MVLGPSVSCLFITFQNEGRTSRKQIQRGLFSVDYKSSKMSFNNGNIPPNVQQQIHLQMLQQQQLQQQRDLQHLTPQQLQMLQQQHQQQAQLAVGGIPSQMAGIVPPHLTPQQQQQLLTNQRLAALKQQQQQQQPPLSQQQVQQHPPPIALQHFQQQQLAQQLPQHQQMPQQTFANMKGAVPGVGMPINAQQIIASTLEPWENLHYWSGKLKKEGLPPDGDVTFFEQLINRDLTNREVLTKERLETGNKPLITRLMKDLKFYNDLKLARMKTIHYSSAKQYTRSIWGEGYQGYGNGFTDGPTMVLLPRNRKKHTRIGDVYINKKEMDLQALRPDELIPIRLEFDSEKDKFSLRDTFVLNANDKTVTLEQIVATLMEDYRFTNPLFADTVLVSIKEQINEYHRHSSQGKFGDDQRIIVKLDIAIGNNHLIDQFEWDISNPENNPEDFATAMVEELSLTPEFITAIAHSIREQAQLYTKSLHLVGYDFKGGFIEDDDIRNRMASVVTHLDYLRPRSTLTQFTPQVLEISNAELERIDKDRERDSRRKRRQGRSGRRGGPQLPDLSDLPKTLRTPVPTTVLPGGLDLGPDTSSYVEVIETQNKPVDISQRPNVINNEAQPQEAEGVVDPTNATANTPKAEPTTLKKKRVVFNHQPGMKCIVSIKL